MTWIDDRKERRHSTGMQDCYDLVVAKSPATPRESTRESAVISSEHPPNVQSHSAHSSQQSSPRYSSVKSVDQEPSQPTAQSIIVSHSERILKSQQLPAVEPAPTCLTHRSQPPTHRSISTHAAVARNYQTAPQSSQPSLTARTTSRQAVRMEPAEDEQGD